MAEAGAKGVEEEHHASADPAMVVAGLEEGRQRLSVMRHSRWRRGRCQLVASGSSSEGRRLGDTLYSVETIERMRKAAPGTLAWRSPVAPGASRGAGGGIAEHSGAGKGRKEAGLCLGMKRVRKLMAWSALVGARVVRMSTCVWWRGKAERRMGTLLRCARDKDGARTLPWWRERWAPLGVWGRRSVHGSGPSGLGSAPSCTVALGQH
jgi:hypothetical protein